MLAFVVFLYNLEFLQECYLSLVRTVKSVFGKCTSFFKIMCEVSKDCSQSRVAKTHLSCGIHVETH
jgi:hypothetical protein